MNTTTEITTIPTETAAAIREASEHGDTKAAAKIIGDALGLPPAKPKSARKPKGAPAVEQESPAAPTCPECKRELGWVDKVYGRGGECKRCTRQGEEAVLRGVPVPKERLPKPTLSHGVSRILEMTQRPRMRPARQVDPRSAALPKNSRRGKRQ